MNSATRRDSISGNSSASSPPSNTAPMPCVSSTIRAGTNGSIVNGPYNDGNEPFERLANNEVPPLGAVVEGPLKPSERSDSGITSPHPTTDDSQCLIKQIHQQAFHPSMSPVLSGDAVVAMKTDSLSTGGGPPEKSPPSGLTLHNFHAEVNSSLPDSNSTNGSVQENTSSNISADVNKEAGSSSPSIGLSLGNTLSIPQRPNAFHGKGSFPLNLTLMLESVDSMNLSHIVQWMPNGQSFVIHDPDQFLAVVLPKFFKSSKNTKIRSFYRKLNRWGFSIIRGNQQQLPTTGLGVFIANTPTKGVWHHPEFCRSRAVECLKVALETGDTGCFLTVTHGSTQGTTTAENDSDMPEASARKKRHGSISPSLTSSTNTVSTDLSAFYSNQSQRVSQRESDFSLGDDSTLDASLNTDEFLLSAVAALQQASLSMATALGQQRAHGADAPAAYGMFSNSFTAGVPSPAQVPSSAVAGARNKRVRHSVAYSSASTNFNYQPVTQSGFMGGNSRRGASWTAGTLSQNDLDFPSPFSFNPIGGGTNPLIQGGEDLDIGDPLPLNHSNRNVDMMESLISMGMHQHQQPIQEGREEKDLTPEDAELANFFEKFAESLQK